MKEKEKNASPAASSPAPPPPSPPLPPPSPSSAVAENTPVAPARSASARETEEAAARRGRRVVVVAALFLAVWYAVGAWDVRRKLKEEEIYTGAQPRKIYVEGRYLGVGLVCGKRREAVFAPPRDGVGLRWLIMAERPDLVWEQPDVKKRQPLKMKLEIEGRPTMFFEIKEPYVFQAITVKLPVKKGRKIFWALEADRLFKASRWQAVPQHSIPYGFTLGRHSPTVVRAPGKTSPREQATAPKGKERR